MKKFTIKKNKYLDRDVQGYYNCEYVGYHKDGNPDFINRLKNMTRQYSELDLVKDFIIVYEKAVEDISKITKGDFDYVICVIPRSKAEKHYRQSQLMFKKSISCVADNLNLINGVDIIKRIKDTKTTHDWRLKNNTGDMPYKDITIDTCMVEKSAISGKDIILVDDIYTENVYVAEDCIQTLLNLGAKNVILYVIAKTRSE